MRDATDAAFGRFFSAAGPVFAASGTGSTLGRVHLLLLTETPVAVEMRDSFEDDLTDALPDGPLALRSAEDTLEGAATLLVYVALSAACVRTLGEHSLQVGVHD